MEEEVTLTLLESEARALLPQRGSEQSAQQWNQRMDAAEDAHSKIKAALREQVQAVSENQESLI